MTSTPPRPEQRPVTSLHHGDQRIDDYAWIRDRDDPAVLELLKAENSYADEILAHTEPVREQLFAEYKSRILETDEDVPYRYGDWEYYSRMVEGLQYAILCRRPAGGGDEQIMLDMNELAGDHEFFSLGAASVSGSGKLLAYSVNYDGNEKFELRVKDLATGELLPDTVPETSYGAVWSADETYLFYTTLDDAHRPDKLWRHRLGSDTSEDVCVFTEPDDAFFLGAGKTRSQQYLVMALHAKESSECWVLPADDPTGEWRLIARRRAGIEYDLEHHSDRFFFITNDEGPDFRVAQAPVDSPGIENWTDFVPHTPGVRIEDLDAFADHLVLSYRADGRTELDVLSVDGTQRRRLEFDEPIYSVGVGANREFDTSLLRIGFVSLTTPGSTIDIDVPTDQRTLRKQQPVLNVDLSQYTSTREWATAADGTQVPISLVWRKDRPAGGPLLLYGYGSYESSMDPWFSTLRLSLLDRGVAFGIAHIRGGGEMGRAWYENGKKLRKPNTFTDFVAAADHLVHAGWTSRERLAIRGGSAGGLLIGAVLNHRPNLCAAAVAEVPFVDALNTILDPSLPLTVLEWDEWGNPVEDPEVYAVMKSYAPYDNVQHAVYPAIYATGGLNDPRVSYWEPAKWVARIRDRMIGGGPVLLKTELGAGHGGPSGRYNAWKDEARIQAFILDRIT